MTQTYEYGDQNLVPYRLATPQLEQVMGIEPT